MDECTTYSIQSSYVSMLSFTAWAVNQKATGCEANFHRLVCVLNSNGKELLAPKHICGANAHKGQHHDETT
ncbi:MAG: hypothetical protein MI746_13595 [Pseudomonadales bacterium]|nr:hypothetical protein [Pseudomonadales bacterium]